MIENGIIKESNIKGTKFNVMLVPKSNEKGRPALEMNPKSITIHETDNTDKGANGFAHSQYLRNITQYVGWHFVVDEKNIYQNLPINENAWHAGDGGTGEGNRTSIGIEICVNSDGNFNQAKENARKLVQYLMKETGIKEIFPHKHWGNKQCPRNILKSGWTQFLNWLQVDYGKADEYIIIKNERDFYKRKFEELFKIINEVKNSEVNK